MPTVQGPTFIPASGTVLTTDTLTISTVPAGANIYYTFAAVMDPGMVPDPTVISRPYVNPVTFSTMIAGAGMVTIKAIALGDEGRSLHRSDIASQTFTVMEDVDSDNDGLIEIHNLDHVV